MLRDILSIHTTTTNNIYANVYARVCEYMSKSALYSSDTIQNSKLFYKQKAHM